MCCDSDSVPSPASVSPWEARRPSLLCARRPDGSSAAGAVGPWGNEATPKADGCGKGKPKLTPFAAGAELRCGSWEPQLGEGFGGISRPGTTVPWEASWRRREIIDCSTVRVHHLRHANCASGFVSSCLFNK